MAVRWQRPHCLHSMHAHGSASRPDFRRVCELSYQVELWDGALEESLGRILGTSSYDNVIDLLPQAQCNYPCKYSCIPGFHYFPNLPTSSFQSRQRRPPQPPPLLHRRVVRVARARVRAIDTEPVVRRECVRPVARSEDLSLLAAPFGVVDACVDVSSRTSPNTNNHA